MQRNCSNCSKEFTSKVIRKHSFCSKECLRLARKVGGVIYNLRVAFKSTKKCLTCNSEFLVVGKNRNKQYCNRTCANAQRKSGGLVAKKVESTTLKNHGVKRAFSSIVLTQKARQTMKDRYGVEYYSKVPGVASKAWQKCHATMKKRGSYASSKIELKLAARLAQNNINFEVQKFVNNRPIDFYIPVTRTYIQIDGVYWHALDRPINEIKQLTGKRDVSRYLKWVSDREQDQYFIDNGLKLIRLTDKEIKVWLELNDQLLMQKLEELSIIPTTLQIL